MNICGEIQHVFEFGQKYRALYVHFVAAGDSFVINACLCKMQYFFFFNFIQSDVYLRNTHGKHCCYSIATVVTRTRRCVTLYVRCPHYAVG